MNRSGVEQWQLVRLITWRSLVRSQPRYQDNNATLTHAGVALIGRAAFS